MNSRLRKTVAGTAASVAVLATLLTLLSGCSRQPSDVRNMTSFSQGQDSANLFAVPPEQMSHVQLVTVEPSRLERVLRLPGTVVYNAFQTTPVISQVSGPVGRIVVAPGDRVKRGEPMLYVSSPDFSQLRANYIKARDAHSLAHKNYVRAQDLYEHKAVAERDLQAAESAEVQAQADLESSEQSLRIIGITNPESLIKGPVSPEVPVLAPIGGEVVERLVSPGQLLQGGSTQCFTISNMSNVWVMVNVYQDALAFVHLGDRVEIQTDAYPAPFHGKISYLGAALDPTTHTLQARIVTENPGERLKNNMYVTATVRAGAIENALAVPDSAVLRNGENEPFVYVQMGKDQFGQKLVKLGFSYNGKTQIIAGLDPGEQVVGDGSLFLQFANSMQR